MRAIRFATIVGMFVMGPMSCSSQGPVPASAPKTQDADFQKAADELLADFFKRNPTTATYLGIHDYDSALEDTSKAGIDADVAALKQFRQRLAAIDPSGLSASNQLDREQALSAIDSRLLDREVIRTWARNPDVYSSGIAQTAYIMIKRDFAPPEVRLKALIARERLMPGALDEARKNLEQPPAVYTDIAIEQIDGTHGFFAEAVPEAFHAVRDAALLAEFKQTNQAVLDALDKYKTFLQKDLKPRSTGAFAIGADVLAAKFRADERVDVPLDQLLAVAEKDLTKNKETFRATAATIAPGKDPRQVLLSISAEHPAPARLLATTQGMLDSLRQFIAAKQLLTIPEAPPARVVETPPFMRATTSASMDTPGPFETRAKEAYYSMTLPDPTWPRAKIEEFMRTWYPAQISNVSVHEVYPGHYTQFLYGPQFPSRIRKVFGANSNSEGWAHYCEQMMLDEGLENGDPKARLAQLQDALLRDVRFIVGIRMHTGKMTMDEATRMFEEDAYQPGPVALSEAKRGTSDATYGYYTLGKLMILKLRDDYRTKKGAQYSLRDFHDSFLKLGPLPLPLIRKAMLGEEGQPLQDGT
jgi:uncharacterized protein (DUF885 family)